MFSSRALLLATRAGDVQQAGNLTRRVLDSTFLQGGLSSAIDMPGMLCAACRRARTRRRLPEMECNMPTLDVEELKHLALEAMQRDRDEDAIRLLKDAMEQAPDNAELLYLLGMVHSHIGLVDRATDEMGETLPRVSGRRLPWRGRERDAVRDLHDEAGHSGD